MAADLQAVGIGPDMVGVMDRPRRQPEHFARQRGQQLKACRLDRHGHAPDRCQYAPILAGVPVAKILKFLATYRPILG